MKRFLLPAAVASMIMGGAAVAVAQDSPGPDKTMASETRVQELLTSKGYTNVSAIDTKNTDGKVSARAMKDGKPVTLEIDMNTGGVREVVQTK